MHGPNVASSAARRHHAGVGPQSWVTTAHVGNGTGEPTASHRTGFIPGPGFKLREKYYHNWQVVCITSSVKKLFQKNETSLHPWEKN